MGGRKWLLISWAVSFALTTWWVATEGEVEVGTATVVGAIVASLFTFALTKVRKS